MSERNKYPIEEDGFHVRRITSTAEDTNRGVLTEEAKRAVEALNKLSAVEEVHTPDPAKWNESLGGTFVDISKVEFVNKPK